MAVSVQLQFFSIAMGITSSAVLAAVPPSAPPTSATRPATTTTTSATKTAATTTSLPVVSATISGNSLFWGDTAVFIFRRTGSSDRDLPVTFVPTGDLQSGVDFEPMPPYVTIPAGFSFASLYVPTLRNPNRDADRTIGVRVIPPPEHDVDSWLKGTPRTQPATQPTTRN